MPEWLAVPRGQEETETDEYGISSFVYRRDRPFHPKRLNDLISDDMESGLFSDILRSKGLMWIASRNDWAFDWSQAGCSIRMNPAGFWWAAAPEEEWPDDEAEIAELRSGFSGEHGDRHQQVVIIGQDLDQQRVEGILDRCLVTDLEFSQGPEAWALFEDPLPAIEIETDESESEEVPQ